MDTAIRTHHGGSGGIGLERITLAAVVFSFSASGCAAPFSEMQSARLVGPGNVEITPSYSYIKWSDEDESEKVQDDFALGVGLGLGERVDVRARYELIKLEGEDLDQEFFHALGVGPKLGLVPDRLSFYAPVGFGFGGEIETSESWQLQPTLLFTVPVTPQFEINTSAKGQIWLNQSDAENLVAFNLGLGIGQDVTKWAVRPEVGVLINPGEDGRFWHFSLGFSRTIEGGN